MLYSDTVSLNEAYKEITGLSWTEFKNYYIKTDLATLEALLISVAHEKICKFRRLYNEMPKYMKVPKEVCSAAERFAKNRVPSPYFIELLGMQLCPTKSISAIEEIEVF